MTNWKGEKQNFETSSDAKNMFKCIEQTFRMLRLTLTLFIFHKSSLILFFSSSSFYVIFFATRTTTWSVLAFFSYMHRKKTGNIIVAIKRSDRRRGDTAKSAWQKCSQRVFGFWCWLVTILCDILRPSCIALKLNWKMYLQEVDGRWWSARAWDGWEWLRLLQNSYKLSPYACTQMLLVFKILMKIEFFTTPCCYFCELKHKKYSYLQRGHRSKCDYQQIMLCSLFLSENECIQQGKWTFFIHLIFASCWSRFSINFLLALRLDSSHEMSLNIEHRLCEMHQEETETKRFAVGKSHEN